MTEHKFQLILKPELYDYGEEEIVYRIYFNGQLICERSMPILSKNKGILDTFYVKFKEIDNKLVFENIKNKKVNLIKIFVNGIEKNSIISNSFFVVDGQRVYLKL